MPDRESPYPAVVVTGCGGPAGANLLACLRRAGTRRLIGLDANPYHLAVADVDERRLVPPTHETDAWLAEVEAMSADADLILAQPDCDVAALSLHRERFAGKLVLPNPEAVVQAQDKLATYLELQTALVPLAETWPVARILALVGKTGYPIWVRARYGAGSRGAFKANSAEQAREWVRYCQEVRGIPASDFLACEYLPGPEYAVQQLWWDGELVVSQARERVQYLMGYLSPTGQTSTPAVARTVTRPELDEQAATAVQALAHRPHGVFGVDMKTDVKGVPCVTEVNVGRFFTTSLFLATAGLNLPSLLVDLHRGFRPIIPTPSLSPLEPDLYWIRVVDKAPTLVKGVDLDARFDSSRRCANAAR